MKRDKKGRFAGKDDDNRGYQFTITFPSIRNIIFWVLIIIIVSPWALNFEISNLLQKLLDFFENILPYFPEFKPPRNFSPPIKKFWGFI